MIFIESKKEYLFSLHRIYCDDEYYFYSTQIQYIELFYFCAGLCGQKDKYYDNKNKSN
jgi:hypothetical protein